MNRAIQLMCAAVLLASGLLQAELTIETVPVGNPDNAGEWSGQSYGGYGPDGICGAVDYEYRIGKYEVTAGQYTEFLNAVAATDTYDLYNTNMWTATYGCKIQRSVESGSYSYSVADDYANRPVNYVSWYDAAMFANWATSGNIDQGAYDTSTSAPVNWGSSTASDYTGITARGSTDMDDLVSTYGKVYVIPTEDEWYKAAYYSGSGSTYYDYPTSTNSVPSNDLVEPTDLGNNVTFRDGDYTSPYWRTEFGAHENSESPYDTFDQAGNVWEWNEANVYGPVRGLRGGAFNNEEGYLHASYRFSDNPTDGGGSYGFRVSEVPEPATLSLLGLGALAMLRRRRSS